MNPNDIERHEPCDCPYCGATDTDSSMKPPSSDIENLRFSNDPPSRSSQKSVEKYLSTLQEYADGLSKKISRMEEVIRRLSEERERVQNVAQLYRPIFSAIRRLPEPILREIFLQCIPDLTGLMGVYWHKQGTKHSRVRNSLSPRYPPWTLSQVCTTWRTAVLSHSSIWSYVSISFPKASSAKSIWNRRVSQLLLQLYRSGSRPLTVALQSHVPIEPHNPLLVSICSHAARWVNLRLRFDDTKFSDLQALLSPILRGNLPNLRGLQWIVHNPEPTGNSSEEVTIFDAFEYAPRLSELIVHPHTSKMDVVRLPWTQITNYSGIRLRMNSNFPHLLWMSNLTTLYLLDASGFHNVPSLSLPSVTSFLVLARPGSTTDFISPLLTRLTLENLKDFRISTEMSPTTLLEFITRSAPSLRSFWFKIAGMTHQGLVELLEIIPVLTSFSIQHPTNELIQQLGKADRKGAPKILPRLRELRLFSAEGVDDMEAFASMVALRTANGQSNDKHLKRICFDDSLAVEVDDVKELRGMGLDVHLFTPRWNMTPFP